MSDDEVVYSDSSDGEDMVPEVVSLKKQEDSELVKLRQMQERQKAELKQKRRLTHERNAQQKNLKISQAAQELPAELLQQAELEEKLMEQEMKQKQIKFMGKHTRLNNLSKLKSTKKSNYVVGNFNIVPLKSHKKQSRPLPVAAVEFKRALMTSKRIRRGNPLIEMNRKSLGPALNFKTS